MTYDIVIKNGDIISMDKDLSVYKWVAVQGDRIAALGTDDDAPEGRRVIDLEGKAVLPGMSDCHVHVVCAGLEEISVNLLNATSMDEIFDLVGEECRKVPGDDWIIAMNYVPQSMVKEEDRRYPDKWELDEISCGHKVMIIANTLHGACANSKAVDIIDVSTELPGVEIKNGEVAGIYVSDDSAFAAIGNMLASQSDDVLWGYIRTCVNTAISRGATMMHGLFGQFVSGDKDVDLILERKDELPITMVEYYQTWDVEKVKEIGWPRIGGCLTLDGSLFEYTQCNFEPFIDVPSKRGLLYHSDLEIYNFVRNAHLNGMQVAMHALGDRAIDQLIYIYRQIFMEDGRRDIRHRIEHFATPTQAQIEMAKELNLILSMQPGPSTTWDRADGGEFEVVLGREGADNWDPMKKIIDAGNFICSGSDAPIVPVNPVRDIIALVDNANPCRNIDLDTAIKSVTINAAYTAGLEETKGSIEVGKFADFAIMNVNPYDVVGTPEFKELDVEMTIWEGNVVYEK